MENPPELHRDPEKAAEMAVNCVHSYLTQCGLMDRAERFAWINRVFRSALEREERVN